MSFQFVYARCDDVCCRYIQVGIRFGHFYAHRLFVRLGLDPDDGVVRISLVHYNTVAEAERLVKRLREVLL